ncbi:MAG: c-type cytochrome [Trueperaceae bacterium]|nr:c-type cytochrome [Trueperaceae bacterium]
MLKTALIIVFGLSLCFVVLAESSLKAPLDPFDFIEQASEQVQRGAKVYDLVCSDCHGDSGLGIAEGRLSFLPEHQKCEKCHKGFNASTKKDVELSERNSFNIGTPPALRGEGALSHFNNAAVLYAYIRAAMPRYEPGMLSDQEYLDITAFLVALNGDLPTGLNLDQENATTLDLN